MSLAQLLIVLVYLILQRTMGNKHGTFVEVPVVDQKNNNKGCRFHFSFLDMRLQRSTINEIKRLRKQMLNLVSTSLNVIFDNKGGGTIPLGKKTNGKKCATVPLTKRPRQGIEAAFKSNGAECLVGHAGGRVRDVYESFACAVNRARIKDFLIHGLRHTEASWMAGNGTVMEKISTYLGHTRIEITRHADARCQPEHPQDSAAALEV